MIVNIAVIILTTIRTYLLFDSCNFLYGIIPTFVVRFNTNAGRDGADCNRTWNKAVGFLKNQLKIMFPNISNIRLFFSEVLARVAKVWQFFLFTF